MQKSGSVFATDPLFRVAELAQKTGLWDYMHVVPRVADRKRWEHGTFAPRRAPRINDFVPRQGWDIADGVR